VLFMLNLHSDTRHHFANKVCADYISIGSVRKWRIIYQKGK